MFERVFEALPAASFREDPRRILSYMADAGFDRVEVNIVRMAVDLDGKRLKDAMDCSPERLPALTGSIADHCGLSGKRLLGLFEGMRDAMVRCSSGAGRIPESGSVGSDIATRGDVSDSKRFTGFMRKVSPNGDVYEGDWVDGLKEGHGVIKWANGDRYDGQWEGGRRTGKGRYTRSDGSVYEGDWVDGLEEGHGVIKYANGDRYDGQWKGGKCTGKGRYTWADGSVYDGDWKDDERTGKGKMIWPNGNVYDGDFVNGCITGQGVKTWGKSRRPL